MNNGDVDQFILANLPATFCTLHTRGDKRFGQETYRKIDGRLQSLRKRGMITFDRVKGAGVVWRAVQ